MVLNILKECENNLCPKRAICCSNYCGDHTNNKDWYKCILSALQNKDEFNDLYISEVELDDIKVIKNKKFIYCEINDCKFEKIKLVNCQFIGCDFLSVEVEEAEFYKCQFIECGFHDSIFSESNIIKSKFKESDFTNCTFNDETSIIKSKFKICKFSNIDIYDIASSKNTIFNQCIFSKSTFSDSCLDFVEFKYTEFLKTSVTYSSLRYSVFEEIDQDFKLYEPPMACDFYKSKIDSNLKYFFEKFYNNFSEKNKDKYYFSSIEKLTKVGHPNYLSQLTYFIIRYGENNNIHSLKPKIINIYKKQFQLAVDTNNVSTAGSIINEYSSLPSEIRDNLLQLSSPDSYKAESSYIVVHLNTKKINNFSTVYEINLLLDKLSLETDNKDKLEVISIRKGSIVETIYGELPYIIIFAGALYIASKATLSILKEGVEVRKLLAETKKIEIENKNTLENEKIVYYTNSIKESNILSSLDTKTTNEKLKLILKSKECVETVKELDHKFKIDKIEIRSNINN